MDAETGKAALALALQRAGRNAAAAAAVAALVPLAAVATASPAEAIVVNSFSVSSNVVPGSPAEYEYTVTNESCCFDLNEILIPELHSNDFLLGSGAHAPILPSGWGVRQVTAAGLGSGVTGPTLKNNATVGQFLELSDFSVGIGSGANLTFDLFSNFGSTVAANLEAGFSSGANAIFDPPIPNSNSTVPEPASALLLATGLAGLAGARARKARPQG
jgi:hypothetical protein